MRNQPKKCTDILKLQRSLLSSRGILDFSNQNITNLSELGNQKCLKTLILDKTPLESLKTVPPQPFLRKITANNSSLSSYAGLSRFPQLRSISFKNTPLSNKPNFRICCTIVGSSTLQEINGVKITKDERFLARQYPLITKILLENQWDLVIPPPSADEFRQIVINRKLVIQNVDPDFSNEVAESYLQLPVSLSTRKLQKSENNDDFMFEDEDQDLLDEELTDNLIEVLSTIGLRIPKDEEAQDDILDALTMLSEILQDLATAHK